MNFPIDGKKFLGAIGAITGVTGTTYMITELAKDKYDGPIQQLKIEGGPMTKEEAEELKRQAEIAEETIKQLKEDLEGADKRAQELDQTITSLIEENERVNAELDEIREMYIDSSTSNISTRQAYAKQTLDYANVVKENNKLKNLLGKFESNNPLLPKVGCWIAGDKEDNPELFGLSCPGEYPKNDGKMMKVMLVAFASKKDQPELFEEYKRIWEVQKGKLIEG